MQFKRNYEIKFKSLIWCGVLQTTKLFFLFGLISLLLTQLAFTQTSKARLTGKVVDAETGEPLIGANVTLEGTSMGAACDLEGNYMVLNVPPGQYNLVVTMMGYTKTRITEVELKVGEVTQINVSLKYEVLQTEGVEVTAKAVKNTESALLKDRQKARSVSDAISAEAISQAGSGDAADAMKQLTGASVVDGKYIYIRGLGDRYTSTQLNGAEIPSTDPYKRAASVDMIPSNILDNIVTTKSFTPDKSGDFSGGTVDIRTKDFPDKLTISFTTSTSFNPQVNLKENGAMLYPRSSTDWLGIDDGLRDIPEVLRSIKPEDIPVSGEAGKDRNKALFLNQVSRSFNKVFRPTPLTFPLNHSYAFSIGNQFSLFNRPLGYLASLTYAHNYTNYDNGESGSFLLGGHVDLIDELLVDYNLADQKSTDEVLWGGLFKASYKLNSANQVSFNAIYNRNGESTGRFLEGSYPYESGEGIYQTTVLAYTERSMTSLQLNGEHQFESLLNSRLSWKASYGKSTQDEPDNRFFTNSYNSEDDSYGMKLGHVPTRYFRFLDEDRKEISTDLNIPFAQWQGKLSSFKLGGLYAHKTRNYNQRKFNYSTSSVYRYNGNIDEFLSDQNLGLTDSTTYVFNGQTYTNYRFNGLYIQEPVDWVAQYEGNQDIVAAYAMIDLPITDKLRFIGGARLEMTEIEASTADQNLKNISIQENDILPSANLIYELSSNMNFRFAYGKSLARPTFRELVPYKSYEFFNGYEYKGNPDLRRTLIDNFDIRWEWFSRPGEIYAVSGFFKRFKDPIEQKIYTQAEKVITWDNVDHAQVIGMELEARKQLDFVSEHLANFLIGGNLSLVHSRVDIAAEELAENRVLNPYQGSSRELAGQSPYLANASLTYENSDRGIAASIYYNVFGDRLAFITEGGAPDVYEQPFHLINLSASWKFLPQMGIKFAVKNLLNSQIKKTQEFKGLDYIFTQYNTGTAYSLELKYEL
ncbi:TonB-dependent receptor [candidate division KSB1 bacterium]|nr:TonB-dependent receptor [candidate division KSB1 bacterium]